MRYIITKMLYCVSYSNGIVGIFSSMDNVKKLVIDKYPSIVFITQVFKRHNVDNIAYVIIYKDSEAVAYVSDDKDNIIDVANIFNKIGKIYEDDINYLEQEIDVISECVEKILRSLQMVYSENGEICVNSEPNMISYV